MDPSSYYSQPGSEILPEIGDVEDNGSDQAMSCSCSSCKGMRPHPPPSFRWALYDVLDPTSEAHKSLEMTGSPEGPLHRYLLASRTLYGLVLKSREWGKS